MNIEMVKELVMVSVMCGWTWLLWPKAWRHYRLIETLLRVSALCGMALVIELRYLSTLEANGILYVMFMAYAAPKMLLEWADQAGYLPQDPKPAPCAPR